MIATEIGVPPRQARSSSESAASPSRAAVTPMTEHVQIAATGFR